jgi:uncharacterized protein (TIRG00374 family)
MSTPGRTVRLIAGVAVSATCVWIVARRTDWPSLGAAVAHVNVAWLGAAVLAQTAAFGVAGLRWRRLVDRRVRLSWLQAFESLMIGNFTNLVVPTRLGDVMRGLLVARRGAVPVGPVIAAIVVERVADLLMLVTIGFSLSMIVPVPPGVAVAIRSLAGATFGAILCFVVAGDRFARIARWLLKLVAPALAEPVGRHLEGFVVELKAAGGAARMASVVALSATAWWLFGAAFVCAIVAFHLPVPWYAGLFVAVVVNLGGLVPSSPGAIGVYHYLAMLALTPWLHDAGTALGFAIVTHALGLAVVIACGGLSLVHQGLSLHALSIAKVPPIEPEHRLA